MTQSKVQQLAEAYGSVETEELKRARANAPQEHIEIIDRVLATRRYPTDLPCKHCGNLTRGMPASDALGLELGIPQDWRAYDELDRVACCGREECIDVYITAAMALPLPAPEQEGT